METRSKKTQDIDKIMADFRETGRKLQLEGQELNKYVIDKWRQWEEDERENKRRQEENEREDKRRQEENEREDKRRQEAADIRKHEREQREYDEEQRQKEREHELKLAEIKRRDETELDMTGHSRENKDLRQIVKNLQKFDGSQELDEYVATFEHVVTQAKVPKSQWLIELQVRLTVELQSFLMTEDVRTKLHDYDTVKQLLLQHAGFNGEKYREAWNSLVPESNNFRLFHSKLVRSLDNWVASTKTERTFDGVRDLLCRNKLLLNMNEEAVKCILMNNAPKCEDVLTQIDHIKSAGQGQLSRKVNTQPLVGGVAEYRGEYGGKSRSRSTEGRVMGTCFNCGQRGHIMANCRQKWANNRMPANAKGNQYKSSDQKYNYGNKYPWYSQDR